MRKMLGALAVVVGFCGLTMGDETGGSIVKIEGDSITIRTGGFGGFGGFGKGKGKKGKEKTEAEEKTFKIGSDVKITRSMGKDKEAVKLTLDELKTAVKVTNVRVTVVHDGDSGTEIKVGGGFGGGFGGGKGKRKKEEKKDE
ncbi:MAG: hypothetical protein K2W96_03535 [Gemmataceae bacterium]|nr:hypothetical protein [Gemmataceae bacterium]